MDESSEVARGVKVPQAPSPLRTVDILDTLACWTNRHFGEWPKWRTKLASVVAYPGVVNIFMSQARIQKNLLPERRSYFLFVGLRE